MRVEYYNGAPLIRMERDDVKIIMTFSGKENEGLKGEIINILTSVYEKRVTSEI